MKAGIGYLVLLTSLACAHNAGESSDASPYSWYTGRLHVHPMASAPVGRGLLPGLHPLHTADPNDAWIFVPPRMADSANLPLMVLLHGAGGTGERVIQKFVQAADQAGIIVVAPKSRAATWDVIGGYYGPDVANIDSVITEVTRTYSIDPRRIYLAGFSDGASYALGLGRLNGDVFSRIASFSPGILLPVTPRGSPRVFISHGTSDQILPIDLTSRNELDHRPKLGDPHDYEDYSGHERRHREAIYAVALDHSVDDDNECARGAANLNSRATKRTDEKTRNYRGPQPAIGGNSTRDGESDSEWKSDNADDYPGAQVAEERPAIVAV